MDIVSKLEKMDAYDIVDEIRSILSELSKLEDSSVVKREIFKILLKIVKELVELEYESERCDQEIITRDFQSDEAEEEFIRSCISIEKMLVKFEKAYEEVMKFVYSMIPDLCLIIDFSSLNVRDKSLEIREGFKRLFYYFNAFSFIGVPLDLGKKKRILRAKSCELWTESFEETKNFPVLGEKYVETGITVQGYLPTFIICRPRDPVFHCIIASHDRVCKSLQFLSMEARLRIWKSIPSTWLSPTCILDDKLVAEADMRYEVVDFIRLKNVFIAKPLFMFKIDSQENLKKSFKAYHKIVEKLGENYDTYILKEIFNESLRRICSLEYFEKEFVKNFRGKIAYYSYNKILKDLSEEGLLLIPTCKYGRKLYAIGRTIKTRDEKKYCRVNLVEKILGNKIEIDGERKVIEIDGIDVY